MTHELMAIRTVSRVDGDHRVQIKIFCPKQEEKSVDWTCRVVIVAEDGTTISNGLVYGIDAIQAIQLSFAYIRSQLGSDYVWNDEPAILGFPAPLPNVFGIEFYRIVEKQISEAEAAYVKSNRRPRDQSNSSS